MSSCNASTQPLDRSVVSSMGWMHGLHGWWDKGLTLLTMWDCLEWCGWLWEGWRNLQKRHWANCGPFSTPHVFIVGFMGWADVYTQHLVCTFNPTNRFSPRLVTVRMPRHGGEDEDSHNLPQISLMRQEWSCWCPRSRSMGHLKLSLSLTLGEEGAWIVVSCKIPSAHQILFSCTANDVHFVTFFAF